MADKDSFQQDIDALIKSSELYFIGKRLPVDWYEGFGDWLPLADAGDAKAQFNVGYCYEHGEGTHHDLAKAYDYYTKASNQLDPRAHYNLGMMYLNGVHVEKSKDQALKLFTQAMEMGDVRAPRWVFDDKARNAYQAGNTQEAKQHLLNLLDLSKLNFRNDDKRIAEAGVVALSFSECQLVIYETEKRRYGSDLQYIATLAKLEAKVDIPADIRNAGYNVVLDNDQFFYNMEKSETYTLDHSMVDTFIRNPDRAFFSDSKLALGKKSHEVVYKNVTITFGFSQYYNLDFNKPISITIPAKESGCFILTACFESYDAPTVFAFRQYRDNHLSRTSLGRGFIEWYYTYGPTMAEFISDKPKIKSILKLIFNQLAKVLPR